MAKGKVLFFSVAALLLLGAKPASPPVGPLIVAPDQIVDAVVGGQAARVRMMGWAPNTLVLNPALVLRLGLKPGLFKGRIQVGSTRFKLNTAVARYGVATPPIRRRVIWADRDFAANAEGGMGAAAVPNPVVIFRLGDASPNEVTFSFPMLDAPRGLGALETQIEIAGKPVRLGFEPSRRVTLVTAAAAATLSEANGASLSGEGVDEPVVFGVFRPLRRLSLKTPLAVGALRLDTLWASMGLGSDGRVVADEDADPSEIVVTAPGSKLQPIYAILLGRDALSACSSLTFDKPARQIRLSCKAAG